MFVRAANRVIMLCLTAALCLTAISSVQMVNGAARYIQITSRVANIRSAPTTGARRVAKAKRDDVFQLEKEEGKWFAIHLFSGGSRYIYKSLAKPIPYTPEIPELLSTRREIWF